MLTRGMSMIAAAALAAGIAMGAQASDRSDLVVAVTKLAVHLDPMGENANVNERISRNLVENLVRYDAESGEIEPWLATAWRWVDETTLELELRDGVRCHDGSPFDANDVAHMFGPARYLDEDAPGHGIAVQFLKPITSVEAVDRLTVRITTREPDALLLKRLAGWMGQVPCDEAYRAAESWERWGHSVVGTGPYRIDEIRPGEYHRFAAFDGYWGEPAPAASVTFRVVPEMAARVAGLIAGEYDIITEIQPDQFGTIEADPRSEVVGGPINNIRIIAYDTRHPALADARVRRAMNMAIDRELIVDSLFGGRTRVPRGMQMRSFGKVFVEDHEPVRYDPDGARALLEEAGYDGTPISYRYMQDYYTGEVDTAQILEQMWRDVGLDIRLELKENWAQIETPEAAEGRGVINWSSTAYFNDPIGQIWRMFGPDGFFQRNGFWNGARFNGHREGLFSTDLERRRAAVSALLAEFERDPPGTYLHVLPIFYGKQKDVRWDPGENATAFMDLRAGSLAFE